MCEMCQEIAVEFCSFEGKKQKQKKGQTRQLCNQRRKSCWLVVQCSLFHFSRTSLAETASCIPMPAFKNTKCSASHHK